MNYETAKKLKDAGYPQGMGKGDIVNDGVFYEDGTGLHLDNAYAPTLLELIKACGQPFMLQSHDGDVWQAFHDTHTITGEEVGEGSTPEIAVANLYLALNTK